MPASFQEAQSVQFGRHLVASTNITPGQTVLEHQPYAAVLYDDQVQQRCDWCTKAAQPSTCSLSRCTRCKFAHYCSVSHQKAAWKAYHKQECAALGACAPNVPPATVRLAARVLWRKSSERSSGFTHQQQQQQQEQEQQQQQQEEQQEQWLQQQLAGGVYADVQALLSHWQQLDDARKLQYAQMAALTRAFMLGSPQQQQQQQLSFGDSTPSAAPPPPPSASSSAAAADPPEVRQIALLLARFACNNHTICDDELRPLGVGIYPLGALVNHDCTPNCVQTFAGRNIVFRSVRFISPGEQLTISYIELAATRQERRRQLLEQYFFDIDTPNTTPQQQQQQHQQQAPQLGRQEVLGVAAAGHMLGSMQESGLHKLRLLVQLPQLPQSTAAAATAQKCSQQELLLWSSSCCSGLLLQQQQQLRSIDEDSKGHPASSAQEQRNSSSSRPPWPEDTVDPQLCQMLLLQPKQAGAGGSSSGSNGIQQHEQQQDELVRVQLPGGMCLLPQLPGAGGAGSGGSAAASEFLQGLFKDLEKLGGADAGVPADLALDMDRPAPVLLGQNGVGSEQPQQQQSQLEAVQWGDWNTVLQQHSQQHSAGAASSSGAADSTLPSTLQLVQAGAGLLLHVWQLQQQAEAFTRKGQAAAAVQTCRAALYAADGWGPLASVQEAPPAAAAAAEDVGGSGSLQSLGFVAGSSSSSSSSRVSRNMSGSTLRVALGPQHVLRIRVLAALLCAAVDAAEWQLAVTAAWQLTPLYELVYPKVWPNRGLHYALLAKLEMLLQQPAAAAESAEKALAILRVTHGSSSTVLHEVGRTRYEAGQELAAAAYRLAD